MKLRKMLSLFVVLVIAVVSIFACSRAVDHDLIPQELVTSPRKPMAELKHGDGTGVSTIKSVAFSPDGQLLASGGSDGTIKLWDVNENKHIRSFKNQFNRETWVVYVVAFSPDGKWLASSGKHVKLWSIANIHNLIEETTFTGIDIALTVDFSPDGKLLAAGEDSGKVKVWNLQSNQVSTFQHDAAVFTVDFSSDGKLLAAGDESGKVKIWDTQIGQVVRILEGDRKPVHAVEFSPNSTNPILVSAGQSGIIRLWTLPDWQLQGTLHTGSSVASLAFSPDGQVLATTNIENLNLWSMENGTHITSLKGHTDGVDSLDSSPDGTTLASGGKDGILRIWNVEPYVTPQQIDTRSEVKLIYFVPKDREPQPNMGMKLNELIENVQQFYADEMKRHGFDRKTFDFEKDENGKPIIYRVDGQFTDSYYLEDTYKKVTAEIDEQFTKFRNVYLVAVDISSEKIGEAHGEGGGIYFTSNLAKHSTGGYALIPASGPAFSFYVTAHELGHAFGLKHNFPKPGSTELSYIMSYDRVDTYQLPKCAAEWLDKNRLFNHDQKFFNELPTIEKLPLLTNKSNLTYLRFKVEDADGLHQVHLAVPTTDKDRRAIVEYDLMANPTRKRELVESQVDDLINKGELAIENRDSEIEDLLQDSAFWESHIEKEANIPAFIEGAGLKLLSCQPLNGEKTATVEFELPDASVKKVSLRMIDLLGNIAEQEFDLNTDATEPPKKP